MTGATMAQSGPEPAYLCCRGDWLSSLIAEARNAIGESPQHGTIDPIRLPCGIEVLSACGSISPHVDHDFADRPWSYILVLRAADGAVLRCHAHADLALSCGMLVEFNAMRRHSLRQPKGELFIWTALDWHERLSLDVALDRHWAMSRP